MLDLLPGLELALYLVAWVTTTTAALAAYDWCARPKGETK